MLQDTPFRNCGIRGRAPGKGVTDSDIGAQYPGKTQVDGARERAPTQGVKVADTPAGISGKHSMLGNREQAAAEGVVDSDTPGLSGGLEGQVGRSSSGLCYGKGSGGGTYPAAAVGYEGSQWIPGRRLFWTVGGQSFLLGLRGSATASWGSN